MTTIQSMFGKKLTVHHRGSDKVWLDCEEGDNGTGCHARIYRLADLIAAIDPDGLYGAAYRAREADEARLAAIDRAEKLEAELAEAKCEVGYAEMGADECRTRAEAAEAKLAKVREVMNVRAMPRDTAAALNRALDPAPPFTLPTEAGARFEAEGCRSGGVWTFTTVIGRSVPVYTNDEDECWYGAEEVMSNWTNHRLLER